MASWFIIAIASIAAIGIIMLAGVNLINVMASETGQTAAIANFNSIPDLILANSWQAADGNIYLPAAAPAGPGPIEGVGSLPAWLRPNGTLATSARVIYCPFGPTTGAPNADVFNPDGSRYQVATASAGGRSYVTRGRPNYADAATNPALAGFVMLPDNSNQTYVGCNAITRNGSTYSATGMLVRPIFLTSAIEDRLAQSEARVLYAAVGGTGNGDTASSPTSLATALARWRASTWSNTRIEFSGTHAIGLTDLAISGAGYVAKPANATLTLRGQARSTSVISISAVASIDLPVNLNLSGLSISRNAVIRVSPQTTFIARDVSIGPVQLRQNASAVIASSEVRNDATNSLSAQPVFELLPGSRLALNATLAIGNAFQDNIAQVSGGASLAISSATVTYSSTIGSRHTINPGGRLTVTDSSLSVAGGNGPTFLSGGTIAFTSSTLANGQSAMNQPVFDLRDGSVTNISGSTVSVPLRAGSQRSVRSQNASSVAGENSSIQGCWQDQSGPPVFAFAATPANGTRSRITAAEAVPVLASSPTAAEITLYTEAMQRNALRASSRLRNSSDWACVM